MGNAVDLRSLFPSRDSEVEGPDADVSDSSSDDAADPQLDIPDAHLGEQIIQITIGQRRARDNGDLAIQGAVPTQTI